MNCTARAMSDCKIPAKNHRRADRILAALAKQRPQTRAEAEEVAKCAFPATILGWIAWQLASWWIQRLLTWWFAPNSSNGITISPAEANDLEQEMN